jgi:plasmid maintenance system antidote protein VapI
LTPLFCVNKIVNGSRGISADTALLLGRHFGITADVWINLRALRA